MTSHDSHRRYEISPVARLIDELHKLPGIGPKSAQRLAYYLIRMPDSEAQSLAEAILGIKERLTLCSECCDITERTPCAICEDNTRDRSRICVVEEALDVRALERTHAYHGLYHVLHGVISPMNGVGPDDLKIKLLLERIKAAQVEEIFLAMNPNVEGEATAMYLHQLLEPLNVKITRPARGLPVGGDLEYADDLTLSRAIEGRQAF